MVQRASVTKAWRVLGLRMQESHPQWRVAVNILNKQSRDSRQGVVLQFGVRRSANDSSP